MSIGGLLGQMTAGGVERSAGGMAEKIRTDAKNAFAKRIQDDRIAASEKEQATRISAAKDLEGVRAANNNADTALRNHYETERTNTQNEYQKGLLVDQRKHEAEQEADRRKWELKSRQPKNELPAKVKAKADYYKSQMEQAAKSRDKAIELGDQEQIKRWDNVHLAASRDYRNLIDGKISITPGQAKLAVKDIRPEDEGGKAFISQAAQVYDGESLALIKQELDALLSEKKPEPTGGQATEKVTANEVNTSVADVKAAKPVSEGKGLLQPKPTNKESDAYVSSAASTVPGMKNASPPGLLNSAETLNKRANEKFKATPRQEIVSEAVEEAEIIFNRKARDLKTGNLSTARFEAMFNQLVEDLELTEEEQAEILRTIGAIR